MELRHLRTLAAVADAGSFTRAAGLLHVAQPALSQQMARLEAELGTALLDRSARGVTLTEAGAVMLLRARRALGEIDAGLAEVEGLRGLRRGRVTVGVTPTPGPVDIAGVLARFREEHPQIEVELREALTVELTVGLRNDAIDLAILTGVVSSDFGHRSLAEEPLVAVVAPDHPLAARRQVLLRTLSKEPFVSFAPGATIRTTLEQHAAREGWQLQAQLQVDDPRRARALVAAGLGVAVLPATDATTPGPAVATIDIRAEGLRHQVSLAWRGDRRLPPAAEALIATIER